VSTNSVLEIGKHFGTSANKTNCAVYRIGRDTKTSSLIR